MKTIANFLLCIAVSSTAFCQSNKAIADKIVAVVGDRTILYSEIRNAVEDAHRHETMMPGIAECTFLEQAVVSKVLMLQAEKDSLPVTEEHVEAELDQRIRYFINLFGSEEALAEYAGKPIYQIRSDSRGVIRERMLAETMQQKILSNVRITPAEVRVFFDRIPKDSLPYLESEVEVGHVTIYPRYSQEMERYTIAELNNYRRQVEMKVATFQQLAQSFSQHIASKDHGGKYQVNRNEKIWSPAFLSAVFRLKEGEISIPVKCDPYGYFLVKMIERRGDDADVQLILRTPAVTDIELKMASGRLDTARAKILAGSMTFNQAALKYSEDEATTFQGPYMLNSSGSTLVPIDQLDKELVSTISRLTIGDISQPTPIVNREGKRGVRVIYLKSRTEPHRMNLRDDYSKISSMALEEKKALAFNKWLETKVRDFYIRIQNENISDCPAIMKYASTNRADN